MKLKAILLLSLALILNCTSFAQNYDWFERIKTIEILKSNRQDVNRIFGQPKNPTYQYNNIYQLKEGKLDVEYSVGLCNSERKLGWNVPEFTVTRFFFTPNKPISPQKVGISLVGFQKHEIYDVTGAFLYSNEKKGINLSLKANGKIEIIEFYPQKKYDNLYCKE